MLLCKIVYKIHFPLDAKTGWVALMSLLKAKQCNSHNGTLDLNTRIGGGYWEVQILRKYTIQHNDINQFLIPRGIEFVRSTNVQYTYTIQIQYSPESYHHHMKC